MMVVASARVDVGGARYSPWVGCWPSRTEEGFVSTNGYSVFYTRDRVMPPYSLYSRCSFLPKGRVLFPVRTVLPVKLLDRDMGASYAMSLFRVKISTVVRRTREVLEHATSVCSLQPRLTHGCVQIDVVGVVSVC